MLRLQNNLLRRCCKASPLLKNGKYSVRYMGAAGGPEQPEIGSQPPPDRQLPFDNDLIWNDYTAPETIIDFDASHIGSAEVFGTFAAVFFALTGLYQYCKWKDPANTMEVVGPEYASPPGQSTLDLGLTDYKYGDAEELELDDDDHH